MVSLEPVQNPLAGSIDSPSSPRISFQADFLEAAIFRSITPPPDHADDDDGQDPERALNSAAEFEFLSSHNLSLNDNNSSGSSNNITLLTADELFSEGKILSFWQMQQHSEKLKKISLRAKEEEGEDDDEDGEKENDPVKQEEEEQVMMKKEGDESNKVMNWLVDEDPSPRPPNCTVLWKELLRLKKQRSSSSSSSSSSSVSVLSPSSSSSSSTSSSSLPDTSSREKKQGMKGMKKLERTRSSSTTTSIRIRPMINVPICSQVKTSSLPPLFSSHKKRK